MKFVSCLICALAALIAAQPALAANPVPTQVPAPISLGSITASSGDSITLPLTSNCPRRSTLWLVSTSNTAGDTIDTVEATSTATGFVPPIFTVGRQVVASSGATGAINIAWATNLPRDMTTGTNSTVKVTWNEPGAHQIAAACIKSPPGFLVTLDHEDAVESNGVPGRAFLSNFPLATTGELGQWSNEIALFATAVINGHGDDWDEDDLAVTGGTLDPVSGPMVLRWAWARANPNIGTTFTTSTASLTYTPRTCLRARRFATG